MPEKDEAGIYKFNHSDHGDDEATVKENIYLRGLVAELKKEIAELKDKKE